MEVSVNGRKVDVASSISYRQVCWLAGIALEKSPDVVVEFPIRLGGGKTTMGPGDVVTLKPRSSIHCAPHVAAPVTRAKR